MLTPLTVQVRIAVRMADTLGDANIPPSTAPESIPAPTNPACAGSWPCPGKKNRAPEGVASSRRDKASGRGESSVSGPATGRSGRTGPA